MRVNWTVETLNGTVDQELEALPADMRARFVRTSELITNVGLERVGAPHIAHLSGPLWEMRIKGRTGISRAIYALRLEKSLRAAYLFNRKPRTVNPELERAQRASARD